MRAYENGKTIAFAGRTHDGRFTAWLAVPKQHVIEIKTAFETFGERIRDAERKNKSSGT
jgi:hypothetical protein